MHCCHMLPRKDNDHRLNAIASGETYLDIQLFDPKFDLLWMPSKFTLTNKSAVLVLYQVA